MTVADVGDFQCLERAKCGDSDLRRGVTLNLHPERRRCGLSVADGRRRRPAQSSARDLSGLALHRAAEPRREQPRRVAVEPAGRYMPSTRSNVGGLRKARRALAMASTRSGSGPARRRRRNAVEACDCRGGADTQVGVDASPQERRAGETLVVEQRASAPSPPGMPPSSFTARAASVTTCSSRSAR